MKVCVFVLLFVFCYVDCRKTFAPIDKNANVAFINMEGGGVRPQPAKPASPTPAPSKPASPTPAPAKPASPTPSPAKPALPIPAPAKPAPAPQSPKPAQITPKPVYPAPVANPITTPGPGSVKQLITFYDSQGKASPIRPYSYSQAVKQG